MMVHSEGILSSIMTYGIVFVKPQPYQFVSVDLTATRTQFDYNLFWNFGNGISYPLSPWTQDANSITSDPMFVSPLTNDYTVQPGS